MSHLVDPFFVANAIGLLAFAVAGTLKGIDAGLDLFGVIVLGVLTALGGGMLRDTLVGTVPVALSGTGDVSIALVGVGLGIGLSRLLGGVRGHPAFLASDAVGLSAFAATGALVGVEAGVSPYGVVVLATLTGVGGGSLADLLLTRVPAVLEEDFYATPAALGGAVFFLGKSFTLPHPLPTISCVAATFLLRGLALRRGWRLPRL